MARHRWLGGGFPSSFIVRKLDSVLRRFVSEHNSLVPPMPFRIEPLYPINPRISLPVFSRLEIFWLALLIKVVIVQGRKARVKGSIIVCLAWVQDMWGLKCQPWRTVAADFERRG